MRNVRKITRGPRRLGLLTLAVAITLAAVVDRFAQAAENAARPNIVLIMADDLGFSDLGCYGGEIKTPNLDALASNGLRFTQFYNTSRCCPTRASLLTGLYAHQAGLGHMESNFGRPGYLGHLNDRCVTIAEVLRPAGYQTLMAGKWNVGYEARQWPVDRGFDHYFGLLRGASNYFAPSEGSRRKISMFARDDQLVTTFDERFYMTDTFTDYAIEQVEQAAKQGPFFLYLAYTAPHSPLHAWPEDIDRYRDQYREGWDAVRAKRHQRMIDEHVIDSRWQLSPRDPRVKPWGELTERDRTQQYLELKMAVYAAQVDRMDQGIGRLMGALRKAGVAENTLVMFLSDNGADDQPEPATQDIPPGPKESSHIYGRPWANVSNTPLRGYKHQTHEGGIATPLVVSWPAVIRRGDIVYSPGHVIDLMATCVDVAGASYPATFQGHEIVPLEGKSLAPIFRTGRREGHQRLFWEHEGNRAVRQGKWKLVAAHRGPWELYDLDADRTELSNLAASHPEKVQELSAYYDAWAARCGVVPWDDVRSKPGVKAK